MEERVGQIKIQKEDGRLFSWQRDDCTPRSDLLMEFAALDDKFPSEKTLADSSTSPETVSLTFWRGINTEYNVIHTWHHKSLNSFTQLVNNSHDIMFERFWAYCAVNMHVK